MLCKILKYSIVCVALFSNMRIDGHSTCVNISQGYFFSTGRRFVPAHHFHLAMFGFKRKGKRLHTASHLNRFLFAPRHLLTLWCSGSVLVFRCRCWLICEKRTDTWSNEDSNSLFAIVSVRGQHYWSWCFLKSERKICFQTFIRSRTAVPAPISPVAEADVWRFRPSAAVNLIVICTCVAIGVVVDPSRPSALGRTHQATGLNQTPPTPGPRHELITLITWSRARPLRWVSVTCFFKSKGWGRAKVNFPQKCHKNWTSSSGILF